jgi:hypothetical protein
MANSLTFTSGAFMQCTVATASRTAGSIYDILTATSSVDRRLYGLSVVSADNAANPVKIYLNDGTNNIQLANINVVANSGNTTTTALTDCFSSTMAESVLAKTRDANGVTYFNLPKNWSIRISYANAIGAGEALYTFVFGENY